MQSDSQKKKKTTKLFDAEDVQQEHGDHREENFESLIRDGVGYCLDPVEDGVLVTRACYSPPMALRPGQVGTALLYVNCMMVQQWSNA